MNHVGDSIALEYPGWENLQGDPNEPELAIARCKRPDETYPYTALPARPAPRPVRVPGRA
ncbi:hypothetical protein HOE425_340263 [Hoeflea sp. EC-HK425]|nr:hypothetical protein HOE425_340263 [Hoeflea sp. EC-HK425]